MTTRLVSLLSVALGLVLATRAAAIENVWLIGPGGPRGDCMMEFALRWDDDYQGTDDCGSGSSYCAHHPRFGSAGQRGRINNSQTCVDNDPCDQNPADDTCTFHVALCFCVDDPEPGLAGCSGNNGTVPTSTVAKWCKARHDTSSCPGTCTTGPVPPAASLDLNDLYYSIKKPARKSTKAADKDVLCRIERAFTGNSDTVTSNLGVSCTGTFPEQASPLTLIPDNSGGVTPLDTNTSSSFPNKDPSKSAFRLAPVPSEPTYRSPFANKTTHAVCSGSSSVGRPYNAGYDSDGHCLNSDSRQQFVRTFDSEICTQLIPISVPAGDKYTLVGGWDTNGNNGVIERDASGDSLTLVCKPKP